MESLAKRYKFKLFSNIVSIFAGGLITLIIPKALGPSLYGNFNFITNFFTSLLSFFQFGTPNAFYTKLSKNQKDNKLIKFYFIFILLTFVLCFVFLQIVQILGKSEEVWPDVEIGIVYAGLVFSILTFLIATFKNINDAIGITSFSEKSIVVQRLLGLIFIAILYFLSAINIWTFFLYHYLMMFYLLFVWIKMLKKLGISPWVKKLFSVDVKKYTKEFYDYSHPLILMSFVTLVVNIGDRWLLQKFGGSVEQGYFSFANQISVLCFVFSSAMTPLLMREFTIAFGKKNFELMASLFKKNIPLLYFIGAFISVFVAFNKDSIIQIVAGDEYINGSIAFMLMAFYPIQQSYGQLSGALFFATDQTKLYTNIGISVSIIGLLTTFIFISPNSLGGLNLGATGLAIKFLLIQFLGVTIGLYFNTKYLKLSFIKFMGHKILVVLILSLLAYIINITVTLHITNIYLQFIYSGFLYLISVLILLFLYPRIIVQDRKGILNFIKPIIEYFNAKRNK